MTKALHIRTKQLGYHIWRVRHSALRRAQQRDACGRAAPVRRNNDGAAAKLAGTGFSNESSPLGAHVWEDGELTESPRNPTSICIDSSTNGQLSVGGGADSNFWPTSREGEGRGATTKTDRGSASVSKHSRVGFSQPEPCSSGSSIGERLRITRGEGGGH